MATVRNVVFDIGGVLLAWDPRHLYRRLIPDESEMEQFLAEICTVEWHGQLDAGRSFDDACEELATLHPHFADLIHAWRRQDEMVAGPVPGVAPLVAALHDRGVPLFLLTNMPMQDFRERQERFEILGRFRGAIVSGSEGLLKPSPKIFRLLAERHMLRPAETLFIDDSAANVDAAAELGFQVHHFVGATALARELRERHLLGDA